MDQHLTVFTIGHSTHPYLKFVDMLRQASIEAIIDVRSNPHSRHSPHYDRKELAEKLNSDGIAYVFLGDLLGGRPHGKRFYCYGVADYEKMSLSKSFDEGIICVLMAAERRRVALMCSEHNPLDCHRCLLVGRCLADKFVQVEHILAGGELVTQAELEKALIDDYSRSKSLFDEGSHDTLSAAYRMRSERVAYRLPAKFRPVAAE